MSSSVNNYSLKLIFDGNLTHLKISSYHMQILNLWMRSFTIIFGWMSNVHIKIVMLLEKKTNDRE